MTVVKKLTQMNLTVCATIHSPTPYCFNQFDRLHLLLRGQTVYFGPNGGAQLQFPIHWQVCHHPAALRPIAYWTAA